MEYVLEIYEEITLKVLRRPLTYAESAEFLGCSERTVGRLREKGDLMPAEGESGVRFTMASLLEVTSNRSTGDDLRGRAMGAVDSAPADQSARVEVRKVKRATVNAPP